MLLLLDSFRRRMRLLFRLGGRREVGGSFGLLAVEISS